MEELKPCPHCGSTNVGISPYGGAKTVICMSCFCQSASYEGDNARENAIAAWNRRAEPENKALTVTLPCKVGDTVYSIQAGEIVESRVRTFWIGEIGGLPHPLMIRTTRYDVEADQIGKTIFLTRKAAEQVLAVHKKENGENP